MDRFVCRNSIVYFDSFRVENIPKEIWNIIENKNIRTNIYRIQALDTGFTIHGKIKNKQTKIINLKYQLQHGLKSLN